MLYPPVQFESILFVEPIAIGVKFWPRVTAMLSKSSKRRDIWKSPEDAFDYMSQRPPWKKWDPRVLKMYAVCVCSSSEVIYESADPLFSVMDLGRCRRRPIRIKHPESR
jgi:hypothetical protein